MTMSPEPSLQRFTGSRFSIGPRLAASVLVIALAGCQSEEGGERKSPFATDNVTVAPQVEGRAPAPTPMPLPKPPSDPTPEAL
jgi:hypothetical protein